MKILCVGHASYDITFPINGFIEENTKIHLKTKIECGGGPSSNAAYLLAKWNLDSYFVGTIGKDNYGKKILDEFNNIGVKTNFLEINKSLETNSSVILVNTNNASRTILTYNSCDNVMNDVEIDINPDIILIDGHEIEISKKILKQFPNAISIIDLGNCSKEKLELAIMVDYVILSKNTAEKLTNIKISYSNSNTLISIYEKLKRIFKKNLIITLEEKGCLYEVDSKIKIMPTINVKAIDTTAAGDIFHGAFIYGIANKYDLEKTLKYANIAGSLSTEKISGRNSIPSLEEVEKVYATLK